MVCITTPITQINSLSRYSFSKSASSSKRFTPIICDFIFKFFFWLFRTINMYTSWGNTSRLLMAHIKFNSRPSMCTLIVLFRLLIKRLLPLLNILTHVAYLPLIICALTHPITPLSLYTYCLHSVITIIGSTTL